MSTEELPKKLNFCESFPIVSTKPPEAALEEDKLYEFDAPKFFDFEKENVEGNAGSEIINPWFLEDHTPEIFARKSRKKKFSVYAKENEIFIKDKEMPLMKQSIKVRQSFKPNSFIDPKFKVFNKSKQSLTKTLDGISLSKRGSRSVGDVALKFHQISKIKRGVSVDTFSYYAKNKSKKIKTLYCPRIHNDKITKMWEEAKGLKWYALSPESRQKANDEMTMMIKNGCI